MFFENVGRAHDYLKFYGAYKICCGKRLIPLVKHSHLRLCALLSQSHRARAEHHGNRKKRDNNNNGFAERQRAIKQEEKNPPNACCHRERGGWNKQNTWLLTDDGLCSAKCLPHNNNSFESCAQRKKQEEDRKLNSKESPSPIHNVIYITRHGNLFCNCRLPSNLLLWMFCTV